jgi:nucleotide-binding universal stress UspA family protein
VFSIFAPFSFRADTCILESCVMLRIPKILHATDFSPHSAYAFNLACSLARDHDSQLLVLHVVATLGAELVTHGEAVSQLEPEAHQAKLWAELRNIQPTTPGIALEHLLAEGDPAATINKTAREHDCSLIVLGTHGRSGLDRLLMGSVAEQVVRKAHCPVLTVKSPKSFPPASQP